MAIELGSAYISILPSTDKLAPTIRRDLAGVEKGIRTQGSRAGSGWLGGFGSAIKTGLKTGVFAGLAAGGLLAGAGLKTAADLEQAQLGFETMLGSARKADKMLAQIRKTAAKTPFELKGLTQSSQKLLAFGFAADDIIPTLTTLGDAAAGLGIGQAGLDQITLAIGQIQAKGKVQGDEILQLTEAGIPAMRILRNELGLSADEYEEAQRKGKILASDAIPALLDGIKNGTKGLAGETTAFGGLMEKQSTSLSGLFSTLKDTVLVGVADAIEPLTPMIKEGLSKAIERLGPFLKDASKWMADFVQGMKDGTGPGGRFKDVVDGVADAVMGAWDFLVKWQDIIVPLIGSIATIIALIKVWRAVTAVYIGVQTALNIVLAANPIGLVILALAGLTAGIVIAWKKSETFRNVVTGVWETLKDKVQYAVLWIVDKMLWWAEKVIGAADAAFGWIPGLDSKLDTAKDAVTRFREGVNAEMDRINDEEVNINVQSIYVRRGAAGMHDLPLSAGGGGPLPRSVLGTASAAVGGRGLIPKVHAPLGPVHGIATDIGHDVDDIAATLKARYQKLADAKAAKAAQAAAMGAPGRVLPGGSYSIGVPIYGYPGHTGQDLPAPTGTPVMSPWAGRVTASYDIPGSNPYNSTPYASYGRLVKVAYANGIELLFAHLSSRMVSAGQSVRAGQVIGRVGMNGNATGPHLHIEEHRNGALMDPRGLGIFDNGGVLEPGTFAFNASKKPEAVFNHQQFKEAFVEARGGDRGTRRVTLSVGERDFVAYMTEVADDAINGDRAFRGTTRRMR